MVKNILNSFQRITTSAKFIPEIDGLRFVAIFSVLLFHLNSFIVNKNQHIYNNYDLKSIISNISNRGHLGVELFFVISGVILSLPFASYYINKTKKPQLKSYFLKRLTRLEPPYIITLIILSIMLFILGKYPLHILIPSFLASLTYTHNFFYPGQFPFINVVAWSLEIEVQFYLIAPLLATVFKLPVFKRRILIIIFTVLFTCIQNYFEVVSILKYIHYFGIGFLLTDLLTSNYKFNINKNISFLIGLLSFFVIWVSDPTHVESNILYKMFLQFVLIASIFCFYFCVLFTPIWKRLFSFKILTIIGGMCYSIYLIHYPIISMIGNPLLNRVQISSYYIIDFVIYCIILSLAIFLISIIFFKLIEQPCMQKDWPQKLLRKQKKNI